LADLKQGLREIQRQQEKEEAFMKFIVKQANRVNYEEASINKNTFQTSHKQIKIAPNTTEH